MASTVKPEHVSRYADMFAAMGSEPRLRAMHLLLSANTAVPEELLGFLYAECCTRNKTVEPRKIVCCE